METDRPAYEVCGIRIDALDADAAADEIIRRAGRPAAVHLCNAYTLSLATKDAGFTDLLNRGDLNLPDGMPLVWIARRLGLPLTDRAYGPDVMAAVLDRGRSVGLRHYLYGSTVEVLARLQEAIERRWPGTEVVGAESPPFRALTGDEAAEAVERVRRSGTDVMWVGLGTPKQDRFVDELAAAIGVPLVAVGAAFDFHAGTKRQAPVRVQRLGLEWAWRLASEPRRLGRRYLVGNARFAMGVVRARSTLVDHPDRARAPG